MIHYVNTTPDQVIAFIRRDIGPAEKRGPNITKYNDWYGMPGASYCGIGVTYAFAHCGCDWRSLIPQAQYTPSLHEGLLVKRLGVAVPVQDARVGDILFYNWPGDGIDRIQHTGVCTGNSRKTKTVTAVEYNTSPGAGSQSDGDGVYERPRPWRHVVAVVRPNYAPPTVITQQWRATIPVMRGAEASLIRKLVGCAHPEWDKYDRYCAGKVKAWQRQKKITVDGIFGRESAHAAGWRYTGK